MQMGAHGGAEAARRAADAATIRALTPPVGSPAASPLAQLAVQQLHRSWPATGKQDPCSTWRARATGEYGRPVRSVHGLARPLAKKPTPPPPSRPAWRASFHLGRLCWMCLSSMERTRARARLVGAVPAGCRGRRRIGGRTRRGALRRAPCYRGVSKREAAVHLGTPPHRSLPGVRFGADCSSRRPARSAASADIFRGGVANQRDRLHRRFSGSSMLFLGPLESSGA